MSKPPVDLSANVYLWQQQGDEKVMTVAALIQALSNGSVKDMVPIRVDGEEQARALKFHPLWASISDQVSPVGAKAGGGPKQPKVATLKPAGGIDGKVVWLVLLVVALVGVALYPKMKDRMPKLSFMGGDAEKEQPLDVARQLVMDGDYEAAKEIYREIINAKTKPESAVLWDVWIHQALIRLENGDPDSAYVALRKVKNSKSDPSLDNQFMPIFCTLVGTPNVKHWQPVAKFYADHPDYYPAARVALWAYSGAVPGNKNMDKYKAQLKVMGEKFPSPRYDRMYIDLCYDERAYHRVVKDLDEMVVAFPDDAQFFYKTGMSCLELGRKEEALVLLTRAKELDPSISVYLNGL